MCALLYWFWNSNATCWLLTNRQYRIWSLSINGHRWRQVILFFPVYRSCYLQWFWNCALITGVDPCKWTFNSMPIKQVSTRWTTSIVCTGQPDQSLTRELKDMPFFLRIGMNDWSSRFILVLLYSRATSIVPLHSSETFAWMSNSNLRTLLEFQSQSFTFLHNRPGFCCRIFYNLCLKKQR